MKDLTAFNRLLTIFVNQWIMTQKGSTAHAGPAPSAECIDLASARKSLARHRELIAEADQFDSLYGKNSYSAFLRRHGERPDPNQATVLGHLLGIRVKAKNDKLYPRQTPAQKRARSEEQGSRTDDAGNLAAIQHLKAALWHLSLNGRDARLIIDDVCEEFDAPQIRAQITHAVEWLMRFAQEWQRREKVRAD